MRLAGALAVLLLVAVVATLELWPSRPARQPAIQGPVATPAATMPTRPVAAAVPPPTTDNQHAAPVSEAPGAFSRRLRCVDARTVYRGLASADVLVMLCGGKLLDALKVEMPLAEAGDLHAVLFVAAFARAGLCGPPPSASFARHRANDIERAQASGAGPGGAAPARRPAGCGTARSDRRGACGMQPGNRAAAEAGAGAAAGGRRSRESTRHHARRRR